MREGGEGKVARSGSERGGGVREEREEKQQTNTKEKETARPR